MIILEAMETLVVTEILVVTLEDILEDTLQVDMVSLRDCLAVS